MRPSILGLALVAALAPSARAAEPLKTVAPKGPYVVVVGVGETNDPNIKPRATAEGDAKKLFAILTDKKYVDVKPERAKLLVGKEATREAIVKAATDAVADSGKADLVVFAFFGRCSSAGDATALYAADSTFKDRNTTAVLGTDLQTAFKRARPYDVNLTVLLDVDFKGFDTGKETVIEPTLADVFQAVAGTDDKAEPPHDKFLVLSNAPDSEAISLGDTSLFAKTVRDALTGAADTEGYEADGLVTVDELAAYLDKTLVNKARELGKVNKDREGVAITLGQRVSHFPLTKNPKLTDTVAGWQKGLADFATKGKIGKAELAEGVVLLNRMPKLKYQQTLRKKYQALVARTLSVEDFTTERAAIKDAVKMSPDDAVDFATNVLDVASIVEARYVKKVALAGLAAAAINGLYHRLDEALPAEVEGRLKNASTWTRDDMRGALADARARLGKREDLADDKDANLAILMMLDSLNDPYTTFWDRDTLKRLESQFKGEFSGVGIQIRRDMVRDGILVVSPIKGSPAYKAGIQAGDLIVGIKRDSDPNGLPLLPDDKTEYSTKGMKTDDAIKIILGKPGVPITLVVERDGKAKDYELKRARVRVESVFGVKREKDDSWNFWLDEKAGIAYLRLNSFDPNSADDIKDALTALKKTGHLTGLVLDLRFDPGGLLDVAIEICNLFLPGGVVVKVRPRVGRESVARAPGAGPFADLPLVVLINGGSASASEIVSACLQDHERATIVGERSYGKGSVQSLSVLRSIGGQVKFTTARYFPPSDKNIDKLSTGGKDDEEWGVKPDKGHEVKLTREQTRDLAEFIRESEVIRPEGKQNPKKIDDKQLAAAVAVLQAKIAARK